MPTNRKEYMRKWKEANKEYMKKYCKEYHKKWYEENRELKLQQNNLPNKQLYLLIKMNILI